MRVSEASGEISGGLGDRRWMRREELGSAWSDTDVTVVLAPHSPEGPSGRMEGLRRPCRCQCLCLLDPSLGTTACPLLPSAGLPGSRL